MTIHALIDADWVVYAAGFASQKTTHVCPTEFGAQEFANRTELAKAFAQKYSKDHLVSATYSRIEVDEESHVLHSAKRMLEGAIAKIERKFGIEAVPHVLMDGDGNFRMKLATIRPYKGHRGAKPVMYRQIREYLTNNWNAELVHDQETDDEMAIRQSLGNAVGSTFGRGTDKTIIVSIDKDMLQVPGWHMNPNKGFKRVSEREGLERLYVQCLTGDTCDNIAGCKGVGPKKAREIITSEMDERAMWDAVVKAYVASGSNATAALENMRLVYLRRTPGELWAPPEA